MDTSHAIPCLPLQGYTVVELGHSLSAPYAGHILAHLGATVIKIESTGPGDHARGWGKVRSGDAAVMFHAINCGKKSVVADLRDEEMKRALKTLILERADIVVQNLKAGSVERAGLDAGTLRAEKPQLIYCNISAFGQTGPLRDSPGYDPLVQAMSGMMSLVGRPDDPPVRVPISVNDMGSGMWSVIGILAALVERVRTGIGTTLDTSLYETALAWITVQMTDFLNSGELPVRQGSGNANIVPYQAFDCADGQVLIAAGNDKLFRNLCHAIGMDHLADDPRFAGNADRVRNKDLLINLLEGPIRLVHAAELQTRLTLLGVPSGPILRMDQVVQAEQTAAIGIIEMTPGDGVRTVGLPISFNHVRPPLAGKSPRHGEHNSILEERLTCG
ncbi:CaiB/BaiF CoA-transferase family protein [Mesorhizobium sp.]|uniref:CaiB/BaiF CoA transferase family protein n=1 Tax=Mesorhizobium sp. TaxID=1871066 RepID=UPI000FE3ACF2|nr:CaiB/BaiF CoA-transferase family protein [Mesorhizobium sp.]RWH72897.1 MAG: CoA transferase [Mesorhizobium sp.]RWL34217.1 MAG: CoA transferase [Mesorhizobium sp.]RWL35633.1 MAG: CoA transferase [Mesorhizobium sp.]RWL41043.1 MAG: CoA transferase [Mesorhizobium sp.]RWL52191.1 MAG: CoA transferase [Mesorhizobium sp.]